MNSILFYETPGCSNNSRQKAHLVAAGQKLDANIMSIWLVKPKVAPDQH